MSLRDTWLRHEEQKTKDLREATAKERIKALDQMTAEASLLHQLAQHPGWLLFREQLQDEEVAIMGKIEACPTAEKAFQLTGQLVMVKAFMDWPGIRARELERSVEDSEAP